MPVNKSNKQHTERRKAAWKHLRFGAGRDDESICDKKIGKYKDFT